MENDKLFEFMEKMYADLKGGQDALKKEVGALRSDVEKNSTEIADVKKTVINIEQEHGKKLEALFDGYKQNTEQLNRIENKVDDLSDKVDKHDIKIQVIEGGKKSKKANQK